MVCDFPVPGGPSRTNVWPATADATASSCDESAGIGHCAARASRSTSGVTGTVSEYSQHGQVHGVFQPEGEALGRNGGPDCSEGSVQIDSKSIFLRLGKARDAKVVRLSQLLEEAIVWRRLAGLIQCDPVQTVFSCGSQFHRDQNQRGPERPARRTAVPLQRADQGADL